MQRWEPRMLARRISQSIFNEPATRRGAGAAPTRRAARLLAGCFVARQSKTAAGILPPRVAHPAKIRSSAEAITWYATIPTAPVPPRAPVAAIMASRHPEPPSANTRKIALALITLPFTMRIAIYCADSEENSRFSGQTIPNSRTAPWN